ncbi:hypothetical protein [Ruegeria sp.]|nr:hypothetical protein [Ruegeria sp.]
MRKGLAQPTSQEELVELFAIDLRAHEELRAETARKTDDPVR